MSDKPRFAAGDLAWVTTRKDAWLYASPPGNDEWRRVRLEPGSPVTIIRSALAKDLARWLQRSINRDTGRSLAYHRSRKLWLAIVAGRTLLIEDMLLNRRAFRPKERQDG